MKKIHETIENLHHETLEKIHAIQENQQEFEKKCEALQATKIFSRLYLKATKLFESTRSHLTRYIEGSELASKKGFEDFHKEKWLMYLWTQHLSE